MKNKKKLQLNKEIIARLNDDQQSSIYGGAAPSVVDFGGGGGKIIVGPEDPVGPSISMECCQGTMMNPFTIGKCCDIPTLSDAGCGTFTRGVTCPSCI